MTSWRQVGKLAFSARDSQLSSHLRRELHGASTCPGDKTAPEAGGGDRARKVDPSLAARAQV